VKLYIVLTKLNSKRKRNCTTDRKSPNTDCITPTKRVYSYWTSVCNSDDFIR